MVYNNIQYFIQSIYIHSQFIFIGGCNYIYLAHFDQFHCKKHPVSEGGLRQQGHAARRLQKSFFTSGALLQNSHGWMDACG